MSTELVLILDAIKEEWVVFNELVGEEHQQGRNSSRQKEVYLRSVWSSVNRMAFIRDAIKEELG
jgi:hypothetical protein